MKLWDRVRHPNANLRESHPGWLLCHASLHPQGDPGRGAITSLPGLDKQKGKMLVATATVNSVTPAASSSARGQSHQGSAEAPSGVAEVTVCHGDRHCYKNNVARKHTCPIFPLKKKTKQVGRELEKNWTSNLTKK